MKPLKALDERHKQLAEELLKGTPRAKIAREMGVHRSTLYEWMKDPLWQGYFIKLAEDLDEARSARLMLTVAKMTEVTEAYLDRVLEQLETGSLSELPSLDTITTSLKRLHEIERTDKGKPTKIVRSEKAGEKSTVADERGKGVKKMLDEMLATPEETLN